MVAWMISCNKVLFVNLEHDSQGKYHFDSQHVVGDHSTDFQISALSFNSTMIDASLKLEFRSRITSRSEILGLRPLSLHPFVDKSLSTSLKS